MQAMNEPNEAPTATNKKVLKKHLRIPIALQAVFLESCRDGIVNTPPPSNVAIKVFPWSGSTKNVLPGNGQESRGRRVAFGTDRSLSVQSSGSWDSATKSSNSSCRSLPLKRHQKPTRGILSESPPYVHVQTEQLLRWEACSPSRRNSCDSDNRWSCSSYSKDSSMNLPRRKQECTMYAIPQHNDIPQHDAIREHDATHNDESTPPFSRWDGTTKHDKSFRLPPIQPTRRAQSL